MALAAQSTARFSEILDDVARQIGRLGVREGAGSKAILRVELEEGVNRIIQAYWTPFAINIPSDCIGLHLEAPGSKVRWGEAYLTPDHQNWVLFFGEREDGEVQLTHYRDFSGPKEATRAFFELANWYVLTAADITWQDVGYQVSDKLEWPEYHQTLASGEQTSAAVLESLKKSTILWLRWEDGAGEQTMPVWFLFDAKTNGLYVLSGERQQTIPNARSLRKVDVILRWKMKNASVAEIPAAVSIIEGDDPRWDEIADKIAEKRLNIPGLPEDTAKRWREECVILDLKLQT